MIALSFAENKALLETEKGAALLAPALYLPTDEKIRARAMAYAEKTGQPVINLATDCEEELWT